MLKIKSIEKKAKKLTKQIHLLNEVTTLLISTVIIIVSFFQNSLSVFLIKIINYSYSKLGGIFI